MKDQKLDALLMFRQESMYWLTGYDTFGYVFFQTLVLLDDNGQKTKLSIEYMINNNFKIIIETKQQVLLSY